MVMTGNPQWGEETEEKSEKKQGAALKALTRLLTIPLIAIGVIAAWQPTACANGACPAYALQSPWVLRTERGLFAVLVLLVLLTIVIRLIGEGELPDQIGREGLGWKRAAKEITVTTDEILEYVISIDEDLQDFKSRLPGESETQGETEAMRPDAL